MPSFHTNPAGRRSGKTVMLRLAMAKRLAAMNVAAQNATSAIELFSMSAADLERANRHSVANALACRRHKALRRQWHRCMGATL